MLLVFVKEKILKNLLNQRSQKAWEDFLSLYAGLIFGTIQKFVATPDDKMDLFLFICERLVKNDFNKLRKFQKLRGKVSAKFTTWLVLVVRNLCIDWYRQHEGRVRLFKAISSLSAVEQRIFNLIYLQGYSVSETFELLRTDNISQMNVQAFALNLNNIDAALTETNRYKLANKLLKKKESWLLDEIKNRTLQSTGADEKNISPETPERQFRQSELEKTVAQIFNRLSPSDRLLLKLWFDFSLSAKKIAELMGQKDAATVYSRIKAVASHFRSELELAGFCYRDILDFDNLKFLF